MRVLTWTQAGGDVQLELLAPTALDDQIVVVESEAPAWFMVKTR